MNRVQIMGRVGSDPEVRSFSNGGKVCNMRIAVDEGYKDKAGNRVTTWVPVCVANDKLIEIVEKYVRKGGRIIVEGSYSVREYEKDGQKRTATEVRVSGFNSGIQIIDWPDSEAAAAAKPPAPALDEEIPY